MTEYKQRILDLAIRGELEKAKEVMAELNPHPEFYASVWGTLPKPIRDYMKELKSIAHHKTR